MKRAIVILVASAMLQFADAALAEEKPGSGSSDKPEQKPGSEAGGPSSVMTGPDSKETNAWPKHKKKAGKKARHGDSEKAADTKPTGEVKTERQ